MIILSWTTKKHKEKTLSRPLHSKLTKIQGLPKDLKKTLRTFQGKWNSRTPPKIQGLFKTANHGERLSLSPLFFLTHVFYSRPLYPTLLNCFFGSFISISFSLICLSLNHSSHFSHPCKLFPSLSYCFPLFLDSVATL